LFLLSPTWLVWGSMARMDTMLVLLNFLAFLMLSSEGQLERVDRLRKWPWVHWILAGLLNSAALMMKSSACTLTLALLLTAVRKREWKKAALFLSAVLFPYLLFTAYWQWRTQGAYSLFLQWQAADLHWSGAWSFLSTSFAKECGWLVLALGWTALSGRLPMLLGSQVLLSGVWFLVAACQSTSAENHMEFFLFAIFALGEGWGSWKGRERKRREWPLLALMMVGLVLYGSTPAPGSPSREEMNAKAQALLFYQRDGDYLALDTDLPYLAGRRIWYQYSGLMPFYRQGTWDPAPLVRDIRSRRFLSVEVYDLPEQTLLPEPVMVAVREDYRVGARAFGRVWYVPRNFIGNLRLPVAGTTTP
jgi:hypothetical protein